MKRTLALASVLCLSGTAFAYDWSGKTGTVTLTEADGDVYVEEADGATVAALKGVVLSGANSKISFNNTSSLTLGCTITGDGTIVKKGTGDLVFGKPHDATIDKQHKSFWSDYYTKGGINVEKGTLYLPKDGAANCWYGPMTVAAEATVVTPADADVGVDALFGSGTLTNTCSMVAGTQYRKTLWIGYYGDTAESHFSGKFMGRLGVFVTTRATIDGVDSFTAGGLSVARNTYDSADNKGTVTLKKFGKRGGTSSVGKGDIFAYAAGDICLSYGGRVNYIGANETTDMIFAFYGYYNHIDKWIDAGASGGVTFTGKWQLSDSGNMTGLALRGTNVQEMVLANEIITKKSTGAVMNLKKQGSGIWRFADHANRTEMAGALFVEEGTLRYDSIAEIGVNSSLGVATDCYKWSRGTVAQDRIEANHLDYEISLGSANAIPVFDYSGSNIWSSTTTRRIALVGKGARLSNNSLDGRVTLLGGIAPAPGETGTKTLYLAGTNTCGSMVGNITGAVEVVKQGTGSWKLAEKLDFGRLDVREGRLSVVAGAAPYKWYRLTITKLGAKHPDASVTECTPDQYYIRLRGLGLYDADGNLYKPTMTDVYPAEVLTKVNYSYIYPATFWHCLQPGQVTIGEYHGAEYRTNVGTYMPSNLFKDTADLYATYLGCTPKPDSPNAFLPIVFRLPDNAPEICYYDVVCDQNYLTGTQGHIAEFKFEGSVDGVQWTQLHETDGCVHSTYLSRASNTNVTWVAGQNCITNKFGYPIVSKQASMTTSLADVSEIKLGAGATLAAEGPVELPRLSVDCSGGARTVEGFSIAETGTLALANVPAGREFELPVTFVGCTNLENISGWSVTLDGKPSRKYEIVVRDGKVYGRKFGLVILVK